MPLRHLFAPAIFLAFVNLLPTTAFGETSSELDHIVSADRS